MKLKLFIFYFLNLVCLISPISLNGAISSALECQAEVQKFLKASSEHLFYPKGSQNVNGSHLQFGYEIEFDTYEVEVLLLNYMPDSSVFKKSKDEWLALPLKKKRQFIKEHLTEIFYNSMIKFFSLAKPSFS